MSDGSNGSGEKWSVGGYLRDRIWRATCWGRVNVASQTGHLWSPPMCVRCPSFVRVPNKRQMPSMHTKWRHYPTPPDNASISHQNKKQQKPCSILITFSFSGPHNHPPAHYIYRRFNTSPSLQSFFQQSPQWRTMMTQLWTDPNRRSKWNRITWRHHMI